MRVHGWVCAFCSQLLIQFQKSNQLIKFISKWNTQLRLNTSFGDHFYWAVNKKRRSTAPAVFAQLAGRIKLNFHSGYFILTWLERRTGYYSQIIALVFAICHLLLTCGVKFCSLLSKKTFRVIYSSTRWVIEPFIVTISQSWATAGQRCGSKRGEKEKCNEETGADDEVHPHPHLHAPFEVRRWSTSNSKGRSLLHQMIRVVKWVYAPQPSPAQVAPWTLVAMNLYGCSRGWKSPKPNPTGDSITHKRMREK